MPLKPVRFENNGITAVGVSPQVYDEASLTQMIRGKNNVMLLDLMPTPQMKQIVEFLRERVSTVSFCDAHRPAFTVHPADKHAEKIAIDIENLLQGRALTPKRSEKASSAEAIPVAEAVRCKIDLILHSSRSEGFLAALKAMGTTYHEINKDAGLLMADEDERRLSTPARLYAEALQGIAFKHGRKPSEYQKAKTYLQTMFIDCVENKFRGQPIADLMDMAARAPLKIDDAPRLLRRLRVTPGGVGILDSEEIPERRLTPPNWLFAEMLKMDGVEAAAIERRDHSLGAAWGDYYTIARRGGGAIDLRATLPAEMMDESGRRNHVFMQSPHRVHFPAKHFAAIADRFEQLK